jgi:hypothetical protein
MDPTARLGGSAEGAGRTLLSSAPTAQLFLRLNSLPPNLLSPVEGSHPNSHSRQKAPGLTHDTLYT